MLRAENNQQLAQLRGLQEARRAADTVRAENRQLREEIAALEAARPAALYASAALADPVAETIIQKAMAEAEEIRASAEAQTLRRREQALAEVQAEAAKIKAASSELARASAAATVQATMDQAESYATRGWDRTRTPGLL